MWFNPSYSANVVTKDLRNYLSLLDKHFPQCNKFHKIFNRNTVKVTYSCMPNMKITINSHNHKIINPKTIPKERTCNYVDKVKCPPSQNCLINNIFYKAVLTSTNPTYKEKIYFSIAETTFKLGHWNHQRSFKFLKYKAHTELSNEVWRMKKSEQTPVITPLIQKDATYVWINFCWTKKRSWYQNADTKTSTRIPSMAQRTDISYILRNHFIVTFRLKKMFGWRL